MDSVLPFIVVWSVPDPALFVTIHRYTPPSDASDTMTLMLAVVSEKPGSSSLVQLKAFPGPPSATQKRISVFVRSLLIIESATDTPPAGDTTDN